MLVILIILVIACFKKEYRLEFIICISLIYAVSISILQVICSGRTEIYYDKNSIEIKSGKVIISDLDQDSIIYSNIEKGTETKAKITKIDFMFESNWIYYPFPSFNGKIIDKEVELNKEDYERFSRK